MLMQACAHRSNLEAHALHAQQVGDDSKQIAGSGISTRAKHLVKGFYVDFDMPGQLGKTDCRINVITQQFFAEGHLSGKKAFDRFAEKTLPKGSIASRPRLNRLPKIFR